MATTIWHNPRCSKSRATLALLEEKNIEPNIVLYQDQPPTMEELENVLGKLGFEPRDLMRKGEGIYKELGLHDSDLTREQLIAAMVSNPILIERPVVINDGKVAIGRPPESVLDIL